VTAHLLAREAVELVEDGSRAILGIAGSPGAGKSTLVDLLVTRIRAAEGDDWVAYVPMDGFPGRRPARPDRRTRP
jgi:pantothenate kinase